MKSDMQINYNSAPASKHDSNHHSQEHHQSVGWTPQLQISLTTNSASSQVGGPRQVTRTPLPSESFRVNWAGLKVRCGGRPSTVNPPHTNSG